jgi:hypothetical protein
MPAAEEKMIVPANHKITANYPEMYREYIKIPATDGSLKLSVILDRFLLDGLEYIYITEKLPSIASQEVTAYNVVRNIQGTMQFIKPVSDPEVKRKICAHWRQILNS